ncbi:V-type proton ATPase subunit G1 isoform X2 [Manihot esculenta]|nr:V-type proton ATPase subunit G1 isoform X2 [Manihot esculenta]XP_043816184.1 V-type proton ATPase subunit G1 isoform X2 [Manihot esculenta]XP_043816185.1 V-type proton ATPase subunit G1 isoform X2 [Manihot esculenta]KAG8647260.1 hypothetical protein MANES_09G068812v8 [Manihot esculenta]KAG8647262.1 hypothetical protein MANES_09G068812v8 [Manihot esculenta]
MEAHMNQGGIQHLVSAEREAQQVVNDARNAKMARLKQAKEEADRAIGEYRVQLEHEFQRKVEGTSGDSSSNVQRLEKETGARISHLKNESGRVSHDIVNMLLKHVTTVTN